MPRGKKDQKVNQSDDGDDDVQYSPAEVVQLKRRLIELVRSEALIYD